MKDSDLILAGAIIIAGLMIYKAEKNAERIITDINPMTKINSLIYSLTIPGTASGGGGAR